MNSRKLALMGVILALLGSFFIFDIGQYLNLEALKAQQAALNAQVAAQPWLAAGLFFLAYVAVTALSLPGAALMTLLAGALFGLLEGFVLVSFASTLGATLAMLSSRFLLRDWVQSRFGQRLAGIDAGIEREGAFYLFALRLVPVFPFFLINLAMGLTRLPARTYWWVSQLGMLPGTLVFVNAGRELGQLDSLAGILSPGLLGAFVLLGVFPLIARKLLGLVQARRVYAGWHKPKTFDRNLLVIGAGSGGLVSAYIAAAVKAKVSLIEKHKMGGDCLNTGCVPSKALLRSAKLANELKKGAALGFTGVQGAVDFPAVMQRIQRVIADIEPHDSVERYTGLGVEVLQGEAKILSPWAVEVNGQTLTSRNLIIAAGARPLVPKIPGIEQVQGYTSDTIWSLREQPRWLLVLGGGPIGCELAQAFQRLGSQVIQVELAERLLPREDADASERVLQSLRNDGVDVRLQHRAERFEVVNGEQRMVARRLDSDEEVTIAFDCVLLALGRVANVTGYGVEELGLTLRPNGTLETDEYLATRFPNIYAVGDVTGPYQLTHVAAHQAWYAAVNALFSGFKRFKVDYRVIPACTFTDPEVARVGLSEGEAKAQHIAYEVTRYGIDDLDRAIADEAAHGFVKVLTVPGKDRILGVTIVGEHAGELLAEYVLAMKHGLGLNKMLGTIHTYPTMAEANKYAAGEWKRAHAPQGLLRLVERFHSWRRS
ncbi:Pyruvate/2-oxoglutarate dehydrogenase complex, dihydrolipoamide dehydrogenase (E3) component [Pseudomonas cuatrocienegasensis]|uniref:Pyruvate/2-oxoglutarate dehydrogenase complex, dihydrolipoamide dehydrogenase (E3) component n=1 Tax=Pseudomonas cuatrocienegasensis TaxID=543360 RepID=A0ABY1BQC8_9PSED|nr:MULTISPECIES: bifunctional TVP38/TMEM64 family protein/FAD-dependent oxidoreductase [Pseudomonas]OEC33152.1 pyridine nucleotide-disulfide oxidoreductase [Pseudomonas sp. 21C1]SER37098.1 Pyruvate/2-oxoglutarate dehydrogenase complex, dihydrolipoamide dehydrogenase (E3) component [Pseudomonas cuatrocienegasensis]